MAQFDVHRNTGKQRDAIPYIVVVQSSLFDSYRRRVVIPLVRCNHLDNASSSPVGAPLNPVFTVEEIEVVLHPLEIVSVAIDQLGEKIATLEQEGDRITAAMDELLTRAWA
ncbi:MAG: CcdB family protein [Gallionella sp.]|nr:CcdB family protein [Gallionella sp.]